MSSSLSERNQMLHILHNMEVSKTNIKKIMLDLEEGEIFENYIQDEEDAADDWYFLEQEAEVLFSDKPESEKIEEIKVIKKRKEEKEKNVMSQYEIEQRQRVIEKEKELVEKGLVKPMNAEEDDSFLTTTRYGRTPLHEAIAMRNIELIKQYLKEGKYLDKKDNNGHTPIEMVYYEGYKEALSLFKIYYDEKKKSA
jgi:hypothetical protein